MASSFSTDLKLELMVTGENSGTWGDKTNSNLNLLQQAIAGYQSIALTSTNTTLAMSNATISDARNAVIKFTGTLSANTTVFVDTGIEKTYTIENATSGAFTLALNQVGGASVIWAATDKSVKQIYLNGTDAVDTNLVSATGVATLTNKTLTSPIINEIDDANGNEEIKFTATASAVNEFTVANAAAGSAPEISASGNDTNIDIKITPKGTGKVNIDGIKYPNTDGSAGQVLSTDGSGNLSFTTIEAGSANLQSSFILATGKSTIVRNAVSISKITGEIGAYPIINEFNTSTITTITTTNANIYRSLDGTHAMLLTSTNGTTTDFYTGIYTPHEGVPVIGNTSISVNAAGTGLPSNKQITVRKNFSYGSNLFINALGGTSRTDGEPFNPFGCRMTQFTVNTSGNLIQGGSVSDASNIEFPSSAAQINNTILVYVGGSTALTQIVKISSNFTSLTKTAEVDAVAPAFTANDLSGFGYTTAGLLYYPSGNTVFFQSVNATATTLTTIASQSINFVHTISSYKKVGQLRWLAEYNNVSTAIREYTIFDVNATTLAFTSISTTTATYSGIVQFLGSVSDKVDASVNLTTAIISYGIPKQIDTIELSTNGNILGFNIPINMSPNTQVDNAFINTDNSTLSVLGFVNTSLQYRNYKINAASTIPFNYIGIASTNDTTSPASVITDGVASGYSGLTIGSQVYADLTNGNITTAVTAINAGYALTSTQILIKGVSF
jgi:hypothetical protein